MNKIEKEAQDIGEALLGVWDQADYNHKTYSAQPTYEADLQFFTLGMVGEAGETANFVKKRMRDGVPHTEDIRLEIADTMAYALMLARHMGMTPLSLIKTIIKKQGDFIVKMEKLSKDKANG